MIVCLFSFNFTEHGWWQSVCRLRMPSKALHVVMLHWMFNIPQCVSRML